MMELAMGWRGGREGEMGRKFSGKEQAVERERVKCCSRTKGIFQRMGKKVPSFTFLFFS